MAGTVFYNVTAGAGFDPSGGEVKLGLENVYGIYRSNGEIALVEGNETGVFYGSIDASGQKLRVLQLQTTLNGTTSQPASNGLVTYFDLVKEEG